MEYHSPTLTYCDVAQHQAGTDLARGFGLAGNAFAGFANGNAHAHSTGGSGKAHADACGHSLASGGAFGGRFRFRPVR